MGLYSDKLWKACRLIKDYNTKLGETQLPAGVKTPKPINDETFVEKLVKMGGVADELLRQCTWEELEECGLPRLLARDISKVFRADQVEPETLLRKWKPVFKKWNLRWQDQLDLAEKLETAVQGRTAVSGEELVHILEQVRDEHLASTGNDDFDLVG